MEISDPMETEASGSASASDAMSTKKRTREQQVSSAAGTGSLLCASPTPV